MIKKTITYTDFDGNQATEDAYFHLTKSEMVEMEVMGSLGNKSFSERLKEIGASNDGKLILKTFKDILKAAYGRKSEDGRRFVKKDEYFEEFIQSEAYSELFMQLVTDAKFAADFMKGLLPSEASLKGLTPSESSVTEKKVENPDGEFFSTVDKALAKVTDSFGIKKDLTQKELMEMSPEEFSAYKLEFAKQQIAGSGPNLLK